ncbi:MAG: nuclease A inhibitor family protein [Cyanobacteria bacterium J06639_1]
MSDLRDRLRAATEGLLWPSETDAPVAAFEWERQDEIAPATLLHILDRSSDTPIARLSVEQFFKRVTRDRDGYDDIEKARVRQFQALEMLLADTLRDPQGFRVGQTDIDAFVIGKTSAGHWAGIRTRIVET